MVSPARYIYLRPPHVIQKAKVTKPDYYSVYIVQEYLGMCRTLRVFDISGIQAWVPISEMLYKLGFTTKLAR